MNKDRATIERLATKLATFPGIIGNFGDRCVRTLEAFTDKGKHMQFFLLARSESRHANLPRAKLVAVNKGAKRRQSQF